MTDTDWHTDLQYLCGVRSALGYLCTREAGHEGIHEAVGSDDQALDRWA